MNHHIVKLDKDGNGSSLVRAMVEKLQEIYRHEHHHFNFYLQASLICHGPSRLYLKPLFEKEMMSELEHIRAFGSKIFALGQLPTTERLNFCISDAVNDQDFIQMAINIEREVLKLYHNLYPIAENFAEIYKDKSIVLLLEENIEHTTNDVEELEKLL
jgi:bacterioferritin (cytochrome b1)